MQGLKPGKTNSSPPDWNPVCLILVTAILLAAFSSASGQQSTRPQKPNISNTADQGSPDDNQSSNPLADEMRVKREIKFAEKEHRQNLDRAKEVSDLGQDLAASFKKKSSLDREDLKKLDKLEKLAVRIRSEAGGSDDEGTIDRKPEDLANAIERIASVSASLNDKVQETPRRVISAAIIDKANVLLQLIRITRNLTRKV
ncbi:MAG: hypothetical protein ACREBG_03945 [Pyrinomonadaceae bacterium]